MSHGQTDQKCVIGDFLDVRLSDDLTTKRFDKLRNLIPSGLALSRSLSGPEFDLAGHDFLAVFDALSPVVEDSRLLKTILDSPVPHVMKLLKKLVPFRETVIQLLSRSPSLPKREHLFQGFLIDEDHEYTASKGFVGSWFAVICQSEKVIVRGDLLTFDFGKPLHPGNLFYSTNEVLDCTYGFQDDNFLRDKLPSFHLKPCSSLLECLLQSLKPGRQSFNLSLKARVMELAAATTPFSPR